LSKLSKLEQEVFKLYITQHSYEEIAVKLQKLFPDKNFDKKSVDNSLVRVKQKSKSVKCDFIDEKD